MRRLTLLCALLASQAGAETEPAAQAPAAVQPVISEIVTPGPVQARSFTGTIAAEVTTDLAFQTLGRVAALNVASGDRVKAGDVLATLDQVTLNEDLTAAQAALQGARAQAEFARQSYARMQELVNRAVATTAQMESAQAALDTAQANVATAEANLVSAQDAAGYSALHAPMDGIVTSTSVETGTVVAVGTTVLTLAGLSGREALLDVPSDFLALIKIGDTFEVTGRGSPPVTGKLRIIEPSAGTGTRSRRIRLALDNPPSTYRLGSLISARLAGAAVDVVTLPDVAIAGSPAAPQVWRVDQARKVHLIPVTLGRDLGTRVIVTGGLSAGDEIVVRGVHSLTENQTVGEGLR